MRWSEFSQQLPPPTYASLVNALTLAWGYAHLAARCYAAGAEAPRVVGYLARAERHLRLVQQALTEAAAAGSAGEDAAGMPAPSEQRTPAPRAPVQGVSSARIIADVPIDLRRVAECVQQDAELTWMRARLAAALDRLGLALLLVDQR